MRLYRICHADHLENHHGLGISYRHGGRWNEPGIPVLYVAATAGVAGELSALAPSRAARLSAGRLRGRREPAVERWTTEDLPADWNRFPYPRSTQRRGSDWLTRGSASLLVLPSAAVPGGLDDIVLVTPARLDAASIRLSAVHERLYNPRAFAGDTRDVDLQSPAGASRRRIPSATAREAGRGT